MTILDLIKTFPSINGLKEDSFARFTIQHRLPSIIDGVIRDNMFEPEIEAILKEFKQNISHGKIGDSLPTGPDADQWNSWLEPFRKLTWFEAPFYFVEAYYYRILLDKTGFFTHLSDPFAFQKEKDNQDNIDHFIQILNQKNMLMGREFDSPKAMAYFLNQSLWGNKSDLSQLSIGKNSSVHLTDCHTFIDDTQSIAEYLSRGVNRVEIVLDNSGVELFADLLLAFYLLESQHTDQVLLHAKAYPTFVSDATIPDIEKLVSALKNHGNKQLFEFANDLSDLLDQEKLVVESDEFWNSPLHFFEIPDNLKESFGKSNLIIFKGDLNYRRIFGDRQIPLEQKLSSFTDFLPTKSIAIRVLKSEIMPDMEKESIIRLNNLDKDWLINGKFGIIQMLN